MVHVGRLLFLVFFLSLLYAAQRFWFLRAWKLIGNLTGPGAKVLLQSLWWIALLVFAATLAEAFVGRFIPRGGLGSWVIAASRLWLVASILGFLAVQIVGVLGWVSKGAVLVAPTAQRVEIDQARRTFFRYAAYLAGSVPFLAATYGFAAERLRYRVEKVDIPMADLPKELDGMKIVQLSDIHIGDFMPREEVRRAVEWANQLGADLAVVTGDFISGENDPLEACIAELSRLRAPLGTWGCNGNHEIYAEAEDEAQQLFQRYGMRLLRHENTELGWRGGKFNLIGVDYQRDRMVEGPRPPMLQGVEPLVRKDVPNVLLSHNPNSFRRAAELGIQLSLAGHTHGGQVQVEIVDHRWNPAKFITDFVAGLYQLPLGTNGNGAGKSAHLYVNRGLGTFGMPVRIGVRPEITLLTLRAA